jgi:hypothetical protein
MSAIDAATLALLGLNPDKPSATLGRRAGSRIRLLHTSSGNAPAPRPAEDRRQTRRMLPDLAGISEMARMRPGMDVRVLDIGPKGVLIESPVRLHIGVPVELVFTVNDTLARLQMAGCVRRCQVASLSPLVYRGALEFDREIAMDVLRPFMADEVRSA